MPERFYPYKNLVIDESLMWKGSFKKYILSKGHRFGVKAFLVCDCKTDYIIDMIMYTGRGTEIHLDISLGIPRFVVKTLLQDYDGRGHA